MSSDTIYAAIAQIKSRSTDKLWGFKLYDIKRETTVDKSMKYIIDLIAHKNIRNLELIGGKYIREVNDKLNLIGINDRDGNIIEKGVLIGVGSDLLYSTSYTIVDQNGNKKTINGRQALNLIEENKLITTFKRDYLKKVMERLEIDRQNDNSIIQDYKDRQTIFNGDNIDKIRALDGEIELREITDKCGKIYTAPKFVSTIRLTCKGLSEIEIIDLSKCENCKIERLDLEKLYNLRKLVLPKGIISTRGIMIENCKNLSVIGNIETIKYIDNNFIVGSTGITSLVFNCLRTIKTNAFNCIKGIKYFEIINIDNSQGCKIDINGIVISSGIEQINFKSLHLIQTDESFLICRKEDINLEVVLTYHKDYIIRKIFSSNNDMGAIKTLELNFLGNIIELKTDGYKNKPILGNVHKLNTLILNCDTVMPNEFYEDLLANTSYAGSDSFISNINELCNIRGKNITDKEINLIMPHKRLKNIRLIRSEEYKSRYPYLEFSVDAYNNILARIIETKLKYIDIPKEVSTLVSISTLIDNGTYINESITTIKLNNFIILGRGSLKHISQLETIEGMEYITDYKEYCLATTNINQITFGDNVKSLEIGAFFGCANIKSVYFNKSICENIGCIDKLTFTMCLSLSDIKGEKVIPIHPTNLVYTGLTTKLPEELIIEFANSICEASYTSSDVIDKVLFYGCTKWRYALTVKDTEELKPLTKKGIEYFRRYSSARSINIGKSTTYPHDKYNGFFNYYEAKRLKTWLKIMNEISDKEANKILVG